MEENQGGAPKAAPPPRPTIALPPRSSYESLFRNGGGGGGGVTADVSPGPLTLVSSFFAEDPDSECRSFSQLLAGAMASPVAAAGRRAVSLSAKEQKQAAMVGERERDSGGSTQNRPLGLVVAQSPFFTVPPGLSPASFLDSPASFSSGPGHFGMSHQQALAQVTAQAAQSHSHMHGQAEYPSSVSAVTAASLAEPTGSIVNPAPLQQMPSVVDNNTTTLESLEDSHSGQRSQPASLLVDKPTDDGYNWRKYGQKQVKGSEYPRSYYKCTHTSCPVKKKVERSLDGQVTEITYKGQHNHQRPAPNRRAKEGATLPVGYNESNGNANLPVNTKTGSQGYPGTFNRSNDNTAAGTMYRRDQESGHATPEQLSGSSDGEEVDDSEVRTNEVDDGEPDPKRRNIDTRTESGSSHRTVTEPRIIVQTTSEVDLLDDGYRWRKYGQKVVKGNHNPRSYYKCTSVGCNVRKHVERASTDPKAVITTYEGKHNHDVPAARNNSHNTANAGASVNSIQPKVHNIVNNQALLKGTDFRNNDQRAVAVLQLKEEHNIT